MAPSFMSQKLTDTEVAPDCSCFTKSQGGVGLAKILGSRGEEGWPHAQQFSPEWCRVNTRVTFGGTSANVWMDKQMDTRQPQGPGSCWCQPSPLAAPGTGGTALHCPQITQQHRSPGFPYSWGRAQGLQPGWGYLEKRKAAVRAAGRARRHIQHRPEELLELSPSTRVLRGCSVRCHWVRMAALAPLHLPLPTSRYW